jgi:hypothetical protein
MELAEELTSSVSYSFFTLDLFLEYSPDLGPATKIAIAYGTDNGSLSFVPAQLHKAVWVVLPVLQ